MTKCSVIIMSWKRPENIVEILQKYNTYGCVSEIIIWNNNKDFYISNLGLSKVKNINCEKDFGLNTRFAGCLLAENRCVVVHDDDLIVSEQNIQNLIDHFKLDYTRIYTYEGRNLVDDKYSYDQNARIENPSKNTEAEISLTRIACFDRMYAVEYFKYSDLIFYDFDLCLNGEDILLSYLTSHLSGKKPLVLPLVDKNGYKDWQIDDNEKISIRPNHLNDRTKIANRCKLILPQPQYPTPEQNKTIFFGNGFYPCGYYQESFCTNSEYKKILVKDEMNGIKYLSLFTSNKYNWSIFFIDTNVKVKSFDKIIINGMFKETKANVDVELGLEQDQKTTQTDRIRIKINEDFISENMLSLEEYINNNEEKTLNYIKFIIYSPINQNHELCLTEVAVLHNE